VAPSGTGSGQQTRARYPDREGPFIDYLPVTTVGPQGAAQLI
jgi:hypothetical protein